MLNSLQVYPDPMTLSDAQAHTRLVAVISGGADRYGLAASRRYGALFLAPRLRFGPAIFDRFEVHDREWQKAPSQPLRAELPPATAAPASRTGERCVKCGAARGLTSDPAGYPP